LRGKEYTRNRSEEFVIFKSGWGILYASIANLPENMDTSSPRVA
jgi:hypothetical protein